MADDQNSEFWSWECFKRHFVSARTQCGFITVYFEVENTQLLGVVCLLPDIGFVTKNQRPSIAPDGIG